MKYEKEYIDILNEELKKAMGCTEPIAIAYAASIIKTLVGNNINKIDVYVSGNIIKNVKSVVVPNTNGLRGIEAACAIGFVAGNSDLQLECISKITENDIAKCKELLNKNIIKVLYSDSEYVFDIYIKAYSISGVSECRITGYHTNVVLIKHNNNTILEKTISGIKHCDLTSRDILNVEEIYEFAKNVDINKIKTLLDTQIECNMNIALEGLKKSYGANIGKTILMSDKNSIKSKAKAYAAAGCDARMNGCNMSVVINSGSGNQGMTCSIPVIIYAKELNVGEEELYRALVLSNLLTTHIKTDIGSLSAYCGVIAAGCAAGCAIAFLQNGGLKEICHTLVNSLAIASGVICDGAKASCAAKVALAVESGILGYEMYLNGNQFKGGDGIVKKGVENTIHNIGKLANAMLQTDKEIIKIMMD